MTVDRQMTRNFSIVLPFLNELEQIRQGCSLWESWREIEDVELLFVDGGSNDGGPEHLLERNFTVIQSTAGRAVQMNAGAAKAQGEVLIFVHVDTRPEKLSDLLHDIRTANRVSSTLWGFCPVKIQYQDEVPRGQSFLRSTYLSIVFRCIETCINYRSFLSNVGTGDQCFFFSKALFTAMGGYDDIPLLEDVALAKRAKRYRKPIYAQTASYTSGRRWIQRGIWGTIFQMWWLRFQYWRGVSPLMLASIYTQSD